MKQATRAAVWVVVCLVLYWALGAWLFARSAGFGVIVPGGSLKAGVLALVLARLLVKLVVLFVVPGVAAWRLGRCGAAWLSVRRGG